MGLDRDSDRRQGILPKVPWVNTLVGLSLLMSACGGNVQAGTSEVNSDPNQGSATSTQTFNPPSLETDFDPQIKVTPNITSKPSPSETALNCPIQPLENVMADPSWHQEFEAVSRLNPEKKKQLENLIGVQATEDAWEIERQWNLQGLRTKTVTVFDGQGYGLTLVDAQNQLHWATDAEGRVLGRPDGNGFGPGRGQGSQVVPLPPDNSGETHQLYNCDRYFLINGKWIYEPVGQKWVLNSVDKEGQENFSQIDPVAYPIPMVNNPEADVSSDSPIGWTREMKNKYPKIYSQIVRYIKQNPLPQGAYYRQVYINEVSEEFTLVIRDKNYEDGSNGNLLYWNNQNQLVRVDSPNPGYHGRIVPTASGLWLLSRDFKTVYGQWTDNNWTYLSNLTPEEATELIPEQVNSGPYDLLNGDLRFVDSQLENGVTANQKAWEIIMKYIYQHQKAAGSGSAASYTTYDDFISSFKTKGYIDVALMEGLRDDGHGYVEGMVIDNTIKHRIFSKDGIVLRVMYADQFERIYGNKKQGTAKASESGNPDRTQVINYLYSTNQAIVFEYIPLNGREVLQVTISGSGNTPKGGSYSVGNEGSRSGQDNAEIVNQELRILELTSKWTDRTYVRKSTVGNPYYFDPSQVITAIDLRQTLNNLKKLPPIVKAN